MRKLTEGLQHLDMEDKIYPIISIDEYSAKSGEDDEMITVKFTCKYQEVADDLIDWINKGYDWAMGSDSTVSDDEYLVFVELPRRSAAPPRIIELLVDLKPLTGFKLKDWTIQIDGDDHDANEESIKSSITLSPKAYRALHDHELENMTDLAQLDHKSSDNKPDADIQNMKNIAGI